MRVCGLDSFDSKEGPVAGHYWHGDESLGSLNVRNYLSSWETVSFSRRPAPWSYLIHIPSHILFSYRDCPISFAWSGVAKCCLLTYCGHWSAVCNPWAIGYSFLVFTSSTFNHIRATKCSGRKSAFRLYGYFLIALCNALCVLVLCNILFQLKMYMYIIAFNFSLYIVFVFMFFITTKCNNITLTFKGWTSDILMP
jgi:hypothetical protein